MATHVAVGVRIRPLIDSELTTSPDASPVRDMLASTDRNLAWREDGGDTIVELGDKRGLVTGGQRWTYDRVFAPSTTTQEVYDGICSPIVHAALAGYNGTVFAYGQTSSGKTHTLMGTANEPGIIVLAVHDVFDQIHRESVDAQFLVRISYFEIYNEVIEDLFLRHDGAHGSTGRRQLQKTKEYISPFILTQGGVEIR